MSEFFEGSWFFLSSNPILSGLAVALIVGFSRVAWKFIFIKTGKALNAECTPKKTASNLSYTAKRSIESPESIYTKDYNELRSHHDSLPPLARSEFVKNIVGLKFEWQGRLTHAKKNNGILELTFRVGDLGDIYAQVPYVGHEFIAMASDGAKFRIEGSIKDVWSIGALVVKVSKLRCL